MLVFLYASAAFAPVSWMFRYEGLRAVDPVAGEPLLMESHSVARFPAILRTSDNIRCGLSSSALVKLAVIMTEPGFSRPQGEKISEWKFRSDFTGEPYILPYAPYCQVFSSVEYCLTVVPICRRLGVESDVFEPRLE